MGINHGICACLVGFTKLYTIIADKYHRCLIPHPAIHHITCRWTAQLGRIIAIAWGFKNGADNIIIFATFCKLHQTIGTGIRKFVHPSSQITEFIRQFFPCLPHFCPRIKENYMGYAGHFI